MPSLLQGFPWGPSIDLDMGAPQRSDMLSPGASAPQYERFGRVGSIGMSKLESMELSDAAAAAAMLHDLPADARPPPTGAMGRANSGLESMQSIEQVGLWRYLAQSRRMRMNTGEI